MHGLLTAPRSPEHLPLLHFILRYKTAIRPRKPHNLRYHRLKLLCSGQTQILNNIKTHFGTKTPDQGKIARLTSVNDGQGRGRIIARVVLIQRGRPLLLSRELLESTLGAIKNHRESSVRTQNGVNCWSMSTLF